MWRAPQTLGMLLILGCSSNSGLLYETAPGSPRDWLENGFGERPFSDSLNFYIQNNPWSSDFERALSISGDTVYLVLVSKKDKYTFEFHTIDFKSCNGLETATNALSGKLQSYQQNPNLAMQEGVTWLDGPSYTIEEFGLGQKDVQFQKSDLWGYGNIVDLAYEVLEVAENCADS